MPSKVSQRTVEKLVSYMKKDRFGKFKACVHKYNVDLSTLSLHRGRTFLHKAAKLRQGHFINYLLKHGVQPCQADKRGDLPIHIALEQALVLEPSQAVEVYNNVVVPLLKDFPDSFYFCDHNGNSVGELLTTLNRYMLRADESDSSDSSSSESSIDSSLESSKDEDWYRRLSGALETDSTEVFGRYSYADDFTQEHENESYDQWAERLNYEMRSRHKNQHYGPTASKHSHKKPSQSFPSSSTASSSNRKPSQQRRQSRFSVKEEISKTRLAESTENCRRTYEERFQAALQDTSEKNLCYQDIPWPSKGSIEHIVEVLFGDKGSWSSSALKKYVREQQIRWHPDKFLQKFIDRIAPKSYERVMDRVKEISQALNKKAESVSS